MNSKVFQVFRVPSLLLAALLQMMPMVRTALPAMQSASNLFAIIFRWGAASAAALGSIQAVSGASTLITTTNFTATNGVASTNRLLTAPQIAGWWSASGLPPGISLTGSGSSWRLAGTPTTAGVYTFTLMAWSSSTAPTSERTTNSNCRFTIVTAGGGGGGGGASNSPPVASAQGVSTAEDTAKAITLAGTDADGNTLTFTIVTPPNHGTLSGAAPNVTYTPTANYNGADSFTFRVNDGQTNSAAATVSISVTAVNDAPVANTQSVSTPEDTTKSITLSGSDVDGDALTYSIVSGPTHGSLSGSAPNVTYAPTTNYNGPDSFSFKVNDGTVDSAIATVSITVAPVNDAPVANTQSVTTAEDTAKSITLTGSDVDGNALAYTVVAAPAHGTLTGTAPNLTYKPATNYNGSDGFTFKVNDGTVDSATAAVSITVTPVNDAPVALAQSASTVKNVATNLTLAGTDVDGNSLSFTVVTQPVKGVLSGTAPNLVYTPNTNATGADSFTFKVNDGTVDSAAATVSITISAGPNTAPIATSQDVIVNEDGTMLITLAGTDADGNPLTYTVTTQPAHGTLTGTAPNLYYRPATNYNGSDAFWFKVNDGIVDSAFAAVSITVQPVNDAPVANGQNVSTPQDTAKAIALTGSDVDGDALAFSVTTAPSHGTLTGAAPSLTYMPDSGFSGTDTFWFAANDGTVNSALAAVVITVTAAGNSNGGSTSLPLVSVVAGANGSEPKNAGSFLFSRAGNPAKALTVYFTLEGSAVTGVDYANPGNKITFSAGKTNTTLLIKPIADKTFEGSKTVVLSLVESTNVELSDLDTASILIGDDDRPRISISAIRPEAEDKSPARSSSGLQTHVHAAAYTNFSLILQCSTDLTNWTVVAAPPIQQPVDFVNADPTNATPCFYRVLYVYGEVSEAGIAEAIASQMFSANLVGVVNVKMQPGWNLAANPLDGKTSDGPLGSLPDNTVFVPFQSSKANTYNEGRWTRSVPLTRSTQGGWFYNPSSEAINVTYVGEIPGNSGKPTLKAGWSVRSSPVTTIVSNDELLGYPLHTGDALYEFNPAGTGADMWITHTRGADGWDVAPALTAGQGVLIYKVKPTRPNPVTPAPPTPNLVKFVPVED